MDTESAEVAESNSAASLFNKSKDTVMRLEEIIGWKGVERYVVKGLLK